MNLNNKFGVCCRCPGLMDDGRLTTSYTNRRHYNMQFMEHLGVNNSNQYRNILINNGEEILDKFSKMSNNKLVCANNGNNMFYARPDINVEFDEQHKKALGLSSELNVEFMLLKK